MNIMIATPELSDGATITGTAALGTNPITNLQKKLLSYAYRTAQNCEIFIDFGADAEINFISLVGHNGNGTATVKAGNTADATDFSTAALNLVTGDDLSYDKNLFAHQLPTAQTYRYWKIEVANTDLDYFQSGRLYLGKAFVPTTNISYGEGFGFKDDSKTSRALSGSPITLERARLKTTEFTLEFGTETEMYDTLFEIDRLRGASKDIIYIRDYSNTAHFQRLSMYCQADELKPIVNSNFGIYQKTFKLTEII